MVTLTTPMTLVLAAEEAELSALRRYIADVQEVMHGSYRLQMGHWHSQAVMIALTGVGKVAAAMTCATLFTAYPIHQVINIGTAGGISQELNVLNLVMANQVGHADVDLSLFGTYAYGQLPGNPALFEPSSTLSDSLYRCFANKKYDIRKGLMLSGDTFLHENTSLYTVVKKEFSSFSPLSFDMESAAIAQCCFQFQKPFAIVRVISDIIGSSNQVMQYQEVVRHSSDAFAEVLDVWFQRMNKGVMQ